MLLSNYASIEDCTCFFLIFFLFFSVFITRMSSDACILLIYATLYFIAWIQKTDFSWIFIVGFQLMGKISLLHMMRFMIVLMPWVCRRTFWGAFMHTVGWNIFPLFFCLTNACIIKKKGWWTVNILGTTEYFCPLLFCDISVCGSGSMWMLSFCLTNQEKEKKYEERNNGIAAHTSSPADIVIVGYSLCSGHCSIH